MTKGDPSKSSGTVIGLLTGRSIVNLGKKNPDFFGKKNTLETGQKSMFWEEIYTRLNPEWSICWKNINRNFKSSTEWPIQAILDFFSNLYVFVQI